jgi:integrase
MTEKAFGLLIRLAVKTGIRASDLLNLEYIQFKIENIQIHLH